MQQALPRGVFRQEAHRGLVTTLGAFQIYSIALRIPPGLGLAFGVSASLFLVGLVGQAGFGRLPPKINQNLKIMKTNSKRNQKTRMIFVSILWPSWLNFWSQVGSVLRFFL